MRKPLLRNEYKIRLGKKYLLVRIFKDRNAMIRYGHTIDAGKGIKRLTSFYARFYGWIHHHSEKKFRNEIGMVIFSREHLGSGIVAHELTHAAIHYFILRGWKLSFHGRWFGFKKADAVEERFAHLVGELNRCFYRCWYSKKKKKTITAKWK